MPPLPEEQFAPDLPQAESQNHNLEGSPAPDKTWPDKNECTTYECTTSEVTGENEGYPPPVKTPPSKDKDAASDVTRDNDNPYAKHYGPDADIWSLYLKETEADDKEKVELWKTGLESLLLFAGLFAAVLSAFIMESRKSLVENVQESLLRDILSTLRNNSNPSTSPSFQPSTPSLNVNYLWFTSLMFTLMSALAAVLAKGWLAKYVPASSGASSGHACERHLRAMRVQQWHFDTLIGAIPSLIQIALFLFLGGLVLFVLGDNRGIGFTILAFIIVIGASYAVWTILPWLSPACPVQTTLSDFLPGIAKKAMYRKNRASSYKAHISNSSMLLSMWNKPDPAELEAAILSWIIINSTVEKNIEEAVKAIAGMPSKHFGVLQKAMAEWGAATILCERFSRLFTFSPGHPVTATDANLAAAYLYALHAVGIDPVSLPPCLEELLKDGKPLHRWDNLEPCLQLLAFCTRSEILLAAGKDDYNESWEETKRNLRHMNQTGSPRNVQRMLMSAAIRSVVASESKTLQKIGTIVLSSIVKTGKSLQQFGTFDPDTDELTLGALKCKVSPATITQQLCKMITPEEPDIGEAAMTGLIKLAYYEPFHKTIGGHMMHLLIDSDPYVRKAGVNAIWKLAGQPLSHDMIKGTLPQIVELLKDKDLDVGLAAANAIGKLAEQTTFQDVIKNYVLHIVELLNNRNSIIQLAAANAIWKLAEQTAFHRATKSAITVPWIIEFLNDSNSVVQSVGANAIGKLAEQTIFHNSIRGAVPQIIKLLKDSNSDVQSAVVNAIGKLAEQTTFHNVIEDAVPQIVELLQDSNPNVQSTSANALGKLAEQMTFYDTIKAAIPQIIKLLKDNDLDVQSAGANVVGKLAEQTAFHDVIKSAVTVPWIIEVLNDNNSVVRSAGANAIAKLAEQTIFHNAIRGAVPRIIEFLNDSNWFVQSAGINAIGKLVKQAAFHDAIKGVSPQITELPQHTTSYVQWDGAITVSQLPQPINIFSHLWQDLPNLHRETVDRSSAIYNPSRLIIKTIAEHNPTMFEASLLKFLAQFFSTSSLPDSERLKLLGNPHNSSIFKLSAYSNLVNEDCQLRYNARNCLSMFTQYIHKGPINIPFYPRQVINQLAFDDLCEGCIVALSTWAKYTIFHDTIKGGVSRIIELLRNSHNLNVQLAGANAIGKLAEQTTFHNAIRGAVPQIIELLKDSNSDVRSAGANAIGKLAEQTTFHNVIKGAILHIFAFLKDRHPHVRLAGANAIGKLVEQTPFHDIIKVNIPLIIESLKDSNSDVRSAVVNAIGKLAEQTTFHDVIESDAIPQIVNLLKDSNSNVRSAGANALGKLAEQTTFHDAIKDAVPQIIGSLNDRNWEVRSAGANAIGKLAEQTTFHNVIKDAVPKILEFLKGSNSDVRSAGTNAVGKLAVQTTFHDAIKIAVPLIIKSLGDSDSHVRLAGAKAIGKLAEQTTFNNAIRGTIPQIIKLLKDSNSDVQLAGVDAIMRLAEKSTLHEFDENHEIKSTVPQIVELLKESDWRSRLTGVNAIKKLAKQSTFDNEIEYAVPQVVELLKDSNLNVRLAIVDVIKKLAEKEIFLSQLVQQAIFLLKKGHASSLPLAFDLISNLPDSALPDVAQWFSASDLFSILQHKDRAIAGSCAHLFSRLVLQSKCDTSHGCLLEQFTNVTLRIVVYALNCLYHPDVESQACGTSILTQLADHDVLRDIVSEVDSIWEFLRLYMKSISSEQQEQLLHSLQEFGILKTL